MKNSRLTAFLQLTLLFGISTIWSQQINVPTPSKQISKYDYHAAFEPFFYTKDGTNTRSASGQPGAEYWQNKADYQLSVKLNDTNNEISGTDIITYTNNSPDKMAFVWMNLDQNLFKSDSRGNAVIPIEGSRNGAQGQVFDGDCIALYTTVLLLYTIVFIVERERSERGRGSICDYYYCVCACDRAFDVW